MTPIEIRTAITTLMVEFNYNLNKLQRENSVVVKFNTSIGAIIIESITISELPVDLPF